MFMMNRKKEQQFSEKIARIREKLYRLAYCYVKNEHQALDIVSEAAYKGYIAFGKKDSIAYFDSWMSRIVINTAIDYIRRNKRFTYIEDHTQEFVAQSDRTTLEDKMDLYDAIDRLIPEEKSYIILKFFVDLSFKEISEVLSISESTVKTRYYRILKKLKVYLIEGEVEKI